MAMGIGKRLYQMLRSNVGHYLRPPRPERWAVPDEGIPDEAAGEARTPRAPPPGRNLAYEQAYAALELPYGAGPEAIRKAHRGLVHQFHPDRFARDVERLDDATRLTQELTGARDLLLEAIEKGLLRPEVQR